MLFFQLYEMFFVYFFCFPNIIMYILNIASTIKKMSVNSEWLSLETIVKELDLLKKEGIIQ